ncbi:nuclear transcription factor Y subunit B-9-like isoform X2 [Citrus sinensis]|uniref:nuclear transcription factor Y subunit B-9-like isoform X2 n=1 Tax=Citrus sinensis TaxID=2711 RepID=UPI002278EB82|nr:nuclear transcription factor Y subunit B-9-like isoform X2 [Citrus sinensis]
MYDLASVFPTISASTSHPRHDSAAIAAAIHASVDNNNNNNSSSSYNNVPNEQRQQLPLQSLLPPAGAPCVVREQDQYMPIANVIRIMRRILPPHAKISDDAKETVQECVSEYISFITGEANERCHREQRKTITAEDVVWAMGKLGFDNYVEPLSLFLNRFRDSEHERTAAQHNEPIPMPRRGPSVDYGLFGLPPGPFGPVFNMGPQQGVFDPSIGGFLREGSGSGSGSSSQATGHNHLPGFDPFAQFK